MKISRLRLPADARNDKKVSIFVGFTDALRLMDKNKLTINK